MKGISEKEMKKLFKKYQTPFAKVMKKVIKDKDLIDTGLMYETTGVLYDEKENNFRVMMQHYFKYLDFPYAVTEAFEDHPDYLKIMIQMELDLVAYIEDNIG